MKKLQLKIIKKILCCITVILIVVFSVIPCFAFSEGLKVFTGDESQLTYEYAVFSGGYVKNADNSYNHNQVTFDGYIFTDRPSFSLDNSGYISLRVWSECVYKRISFTVDLTTSSLLSVHETDTIYGYNIPKIYYSSTQPYYYNISGYYPVNELGQSSLYKTNGSKYILTNCTVDDVTVNLNNSTNPNKSNFINYFSCNDTSFAEYAPEIFEDISLKNSLVKPYNGTWKFTDSLGVKNFVVDDNFDRWQYACTYYKDNELAYVQYFKSKPSIRDYTIDGKRYICLFLDEMSLNVNCTYINYKQLESSNKYLIPNLDNTVPGMFFKTSVSGVDMVGCVFPTDEHYKLTFNFNIDTNNPFAYNAQDITTDGNGNIVSKSDTTKDDYITDDDSQTKNIHRDGTVTGEKEASTSEINTSDFPSFINSISTFFQNVYKVFPAPLVNILTFGLVIIVGIGIIRLVVG